MHHLYAKMFSKVCLKCQKNKFWIVCVFALLLTYRLYKPMPIKTTFQCNEGHSVYRIPVNITVPTWEHLYANIKVSKRHGLNNTAATNDVAIVVPYRDRESHLKLFMQHMHPFLQKQKLAYRIYVIEQKHGSIFNRAMLMNIGFVESLNVAKYGGFIFHDVDLLPRDSRISYAIPNVPTHMSPAYDKFNYRLLYHDMFGGVTSFSKDDFVRVNGFSNQYYGWGGEDDDLFLRVLYSGFNIARYAECIGQYNMMLHEDSSQTLANPQRCKQLHYLEENKDSYKKDGLNTLKYKLIHTEHRKLYTHMLVDINNTNITNFGDCSSASIVRINHMYLTVMLVSLYACCSNMFCLFDSDCIII